MTAIVELKDATVKVNNGFDTEKTILDHVNLTIREGDFITILGGNGAVTSSPMMKIWPVVKPSFFTTVFGNQEGLNHAKFISTQRNFKVWLNVSVMV